jgi:hypothetical protein
MAAERDQAGAAGPGLSGGGFGERDEAGLRAGTTGSSAMGDRPGVGEVHTGLHSGSGSGEYGGIAFASETSSTGHAGLRDRAGEAVRGAASTVKERAGQAAHQARDRLGQVRERTHTLLEERGMIERIGENPLPVLGVAFAAGFLLASVGQNRETKATRARNDLRSALMAGVSAGLAQGARGFLGQAGRPEGFVNTFLSSLAGGGRGGSGGGGGTGGSSYRAGATAGAGTTHRPPSHRENL